MRKKNYKGRCEKQSLEKFTTICKTYEPLQAAYANILVKNKDIVEVRCNVILDGEKCSDYMTDFVCKKTDGELMVRECISRKLLSRPQMAGTVVQILNMKHDVFTLNITASMKVDTSRSREMLKRLICFGKHYR